MEAYYQSKIGYQPVCRGLDATGELAWELQEKQRWHQKMFPVHYKGDFRDQWMWMVLTEKHGIEWREDDNLQVV